MKILLVGNHPQDSVDSLSMGLFGELLYEVLKTNGHEVRLIKPKPWLWSPIKRLPRLRKWAKYVDQYLFFPGSLRRMAAWADVVHVCDHSNAQFLDFVSGKPALVTCHDVIGIKRALGHFPEERASWSGRLLQAWTVRGLRKSDCIACVSKFVQAELDALLDRDLPCTALVYNGLNHPYSPMDLETAERYLAGLGISNNASFMLHVGSAEWKKNRKGVIEIFAELRRLGDPLAGGELIFAGAPLEQALVDYAWELGLGTVVRSFSHLDYLNLCALYSRASLLLLPSLYEGFGWPIIEAQACGTLVATSDRDPMREVASGGAILVDPENAVKAAHHIASVSPPEREAVRRRGVENAKRFSPQIMIDEYTCLYRKLLDAEMESTLLPQNP